MSDNPNVLTFPHVPFDGLWLWARNTLGVPRDKFTLSHVRLCELSPDYRPMHRTGTELSRYVIRYSRSGHAPRLLYMRATRAFCTAKVESRAHQEWTAPVECASDDNQVRQLHERASNSSRVAASCVGCLDGAFVPGLLCRGQGWKMVPMRPRPPGVRCVLLG